MIRGTVNSFREALLRIEIRGAEGRAHEVEAVVDTGYDGALTLPSEWVALLQLPFRRRASALLGDGSRTVHDVHEGVDLWHGRERRISIDVAETEPLLGMALLDGCELTVHVVEGGPVSVQELAPS
jgi:clan AA aspartic protease